MEKKWTRGAIVGRGSSATVSVAVAADLRVMAVKSAPLSRSSLLHREKSILAQLDGCPHIVRCLGDDVTAARGGATALYNLFLEYIPGGSLSDLLSRSGGRLPEPSVQRYTLSLLKGLQHIHARGYVHCDVKLQNVLVCSDRDVKIADFGLAKKAAERADGGAENCFRGTPLYMAPESVAREQCEPPADIWSLGCAVAEMASGRPAWKFSAAAGDVWTLLLRIGFGDELPDIPEELSAEGKDFVSKCLVRDPNERWTAEMLLGHPFIASQMEDRDAEDFEQTFVDAKCKDARPSPRSIFDFSESLSAGSPFASTLSMSVESLAPDYPADVLIDRIRGLATGPPADWFCSSSDEGWITVRHSEEPKRLNCEIELESMVVLDDRVGRDESRGGEEWERDGEVSCATTELVLPAGGGVWRKECDNNSDMDSEIKVCPEILIGGVGGHSSGCWLDSSRSSLSQHCIYEPILQGIKT